MPAITAAMIQNSLKPQCFTNRFDAHTPSRIGIKNEILICDTIISPCAVFSAVFLRSSCIRSASEKSARRLIAYNKKLLFAFSDSLIIRIFVIIHDTPKSSSCQTKNWQSDRIEDATISPFPRPFTFTEQNKNKSPAKIYPPAELVNPK